MTDRSIQQKQESRDQLKSGIITAFIWGLLLLFLFWYKVVEKMPEKKEIETRMLINFGDNKNGNGAEEPENQSGSQAAQPEIQPKEKEPEPQPAPKEIVETPKIPAPKEKIITGNSEKTVAKTSDKKSKNAENSAASSAKNTSKKSGSKAISANAKTGSGDGQGAAAIGNLLKGRGKKTTTQGSGNDNGNAGDPIGGEGSGDSKIGIDRKLVGYIPGTMGRGGKQPAHDCEADGSITISYKVDQAGNVVSAHRSGGISDPCVVSTSVGWVKKYVKAEKATSSSTGTYKITF